jgi:hypothetical protein
MKRNGIFYIIFPILNLLVKVSHKRLSKAHTCCHHMVHISKLDILDCSTLGFKICFFGQSLCPFTTFLYIFWQAITINFFLLLFKMFERGVTVSSKLQKMSFQKWCSDLLGSLHFLFHSYYKLLHNKNAIKFSNYMSIIVEN